MDCKRQTIPVLNTVSYRARRDGKLFTLSISNFSGPNSSPSHVIMLSNGSVKLLGNDQADTRFEYLFM
jgi:hypothetical protein